MSSDYGRDAPTGQVQSDQDSKGDNQARFYTAWASVGEIILFLLTCATAKLIGKRLETLSQAAFIPATGHGNMMAVASLMAMSPSGVKDMLNRNGIPFSKPGDERIINFPDLVKSFADPKGANMTTHANNTRAETVENNSENTTACHCLAKLHAFLTGLIIQSRPAIEAGTIYTRQQVERNLSVSDHTVTLWIDRGLRVFQPGTKSMFFLGGDILKFIQDYKPQDKPKTYAEKQAVRKQRPKM